MFERYVALAREAAASGDRIAAENLYQHAEHYFRVMNANGDPSQHGARPITPADVDLGETEAGRDGSDDDELLQTALPINPGEEQPSGL